MRFRKYVRAVDRHGVLPGRFNPSLEIRYTPNMRPRVLILDKVSILLLRFGRHGEGRGGVRQDDQGFNPSLEILETVDMIKPRLAVMGFNPSLEILFKCFAPKKGVGKKRVSILLLRFRVFLCFVFGGF